MVRFELTIESPRCQFSKLVPSTTQPHLRIFVKGDPTQNRTAINGLKTRCPNR